MMNQGPTYQVRHCPVCGEDWALSAEFAVCGNCGADTTVLAAPRTDTYDRAPSYGESWNARRTIREQQRLAEADIEAALELRLKPMLANLAYELDVLWPAWSGLGDPALDA